MRRIGSGFSRRSSRRFSQTFSRAPSEGSSDTQFSHEDLLVTWIFEDQPFQFYGDYQSKINGCCEISVRKDVKRVLGFTVGFRGVADGQFLLAVPQQWKDRDAQGTTTPHKDITKTRLRESWSIFNQELDVLSRISNEYFTLPAGANFSKTIRFHFPFNECLLPSSCSLMGGTEDNQGCVSVRYEAYLRVTYQDKKTREVLYQEYTYPLPLQSRQPLDLPVNIEFSTYVSRHVFANKAKEFYYDTRHERLRQNPLIKRGRRSRRITVAYDELMKDIKLDCQFQVKDFINVKKPLESIIKMKFRYQLDTPLEPDFSVNGDTTGLGRFKILSLSLYNLYSLDMVVKGNEYSTLGTFRLFKLAFNEVYIDIKDFRYNERTGVYEMDFPGRLLSEAMPDSLIHYFREPATICGGVDKRFQCTSTAMFNLTIASANESEGLMKVFRAKTKALFYV